MATGWSDGMEIDLDMVQLGKRATLHVNVNVNIKREREMRTRIWIACQLIKIAARIANMGVEFKDNS